MSCSGLQHQKMLPYKKYSQNLLKVGKILKKKAEKKIKRQDRSMIKETNPQLHILPLCPSLIPYNHPWQTGRGKTGKSYQVVIHVYILLDLLEQSLVDLAKRKKLRMTHLLGKLKYDKKYLLQSFLFI